MVAALVGAREVLQSVRFVVEQRRAALVELGLRDRRLGHLPGGADLREHDRQHDAQRSRYGGRDERAPGTARAPDPALAALEEPALELAQRLLGDETQGLLDHVGAPQEARLVVLVVPLLRRGPELLAP